MQVVADDHHQADPPQLTPEIGTEGAERFQFSLTGYEKNKTGNKNKAGSDKPVDKIQYFKPLRLAISRNHKSIENMNLHHDHDCPAAQQIDKNKTGFFCHESLREIVCFRIDNRL